MTTQQIVMLIILLVSFIVIIIFIFFLQPGELTNKEICHNSVVLQDKSVGFSGGVDCKTSYFCVSGGDNCEEGSQKVKVNEEKKEEIFKAMADSMSDCWWMFGEGKIDYTSSKDLECAVCSIISFDKKVQEKYPELSYSEFYNYLEKTKKTGTETYLRYLYGVFNVDDLDFSSGFNKTDLNENINTMEKYSIITGYDDDWPLIGGGDDIMKVVFINTRETSKTECDEFITRA